MNKKTDNAHLDDKINIRKYFINKYTNGPFSVIDYCAGSGYIWNRLRKEYECQYWGIDVKPKNGRLKAKSERILAAGAVADVIDIDTYGSPWEHYLSLLPNIRKNTIIFLTIGSTHMCNQSKKAVDISGIKFASLRCPISLLSKFQDTITGCCISKYIDYKLTLKECQMIKHERVKYIGMYIKA